MQCSRAQFFDDGAMLLIEPEFQCLFAVGVKREEVKIVIGPAVQDAAAEIDGGVNEGIGRPAVFGLK
jgi:hypothetical protein